MLFLIPLNVDLTDPTNNSMYLANPVDMYVQNQERGSLDRYYNPMKFPYQTTEKYYPNFRFDILSSDNLDFTSEKSVKSLREYQLGIVFADQYGRETPVISNSSGTKALEKEEGRKINQMQVGFNNLKFPNT